MAEREKHPYSTLVFYFPNPYLSGAAGDRRRIGSVRVRLAAAGTVARNFV